MPVKVLMFCPQFRPLIGGAEIQAETLASAIVRKGVSVTILTPRLDPFSPDSEDCCGVRIERFRLIDLSRRFPFPGIGIMNVPFILWQIVTVLRKKIGLYDVLHCHIGSLQTAGAAISAKLCSVPSICKAASAGQASELGMIERSGYSGKMITWLIRSTITCWVATTQDVGKALVRAGVSQDKIFYNPNGVQLQGASLQSRRVKKKVRHFLYLGRLSQRCNRDFHTLIRSFEMLAADDPEVQLALVGDGDLMDEIRRIVHSGDAHDRILLPGFDSVDKWLAWADCFVLPSRREGLSNALLEAMSYGLPCIANDIPSNREVLADGAAGVLVPVGDADRLCEAMRHMVKKQEYSEEMGEQALNRVITNYGIDSVAERYLVLYDKLTTA